MPRDAAVPLLALGGVSKRFGAVQALVDVTFRVHAGQVMALVGDNGAGKSTLIKAIAGIHTIDAGEIHYEGRHVDIRGPRDAARLGIATVYQDLALADNLDVVQNMFLGRELTTRFGALDEIAMESRAIATLDQLALSAVGPVRQRVATLSGGQRQAVAVARAVLWRARLVMLDEPTAALGVAQTGHVLALVRRLAQQGLGVVLISHNMHDVFEVADAITVLRLGRTVAELRRDEVTPAQVVEAITTGAIAGAPGERVP